MHRRRLGRHASLALVAATSLVSVRCGDATPPRTPASIVVVSGDRQTGVVGHTLPAPIVVRVVDGNGNPVQNASVGFDVTGGGRVNPPTLASDGDGRVIVTWTLGTKAGESQAAIATISSATSTPVQTHIEATSVADVPVGLTADATTRASGGAGAAFTTPPRVRVTDQYQNTAPAAGVVVTASLSPTDDTHSLLGGTNATTDASGVATFDKLAIGGKAGTASLRFNAGSLNETSSNVSLSAGPAHALRVVGNASLEAAAGASGPLVAIQVLDAYDNAAPGVSVAFTIADGQPIVVTSDSSGIATLSTWTLPRTAGSYQLVASAAGAGSASIAVKARAGVVAHIEFLNAPTTLPLEATQSLSVRLLDDANAPLFGEIVEWAVVSGAGRLSLPTSVSGVGGIAQITYDVGTVSGPRRIRATVGSVIAYADIGVAPGPYVGIRGGAQGLIVPAGSHAMLQVKSVDKFGNGVGNIPLTTRIGDAGIVAGSISPTTATTNPEGDFTFDVQVGPWPGPYYYVAQGPGGIFGSGASLMLQATSNQGVILPASFTATAKIGEVVSFDFDIYGPDGNPASVPVTFKVPAGGEFRCLSGFSGSWTTTTGSVISGNFGAGVCWLPPAIAGTYTMTVTTPAGFSNNPVTITIKVIP